VLLLAALGFAAAIAARSIAAANEPSADPKSGPAAATSAPRGPRIEGGQVNGHWREGTRLIDQLGQFKITGDRVSFTSSDGTLHFDCLENLCAQRIARTVTDSPETLLWSVNGELTEYRGTNFLLLTQAILKPRTSRSTTAP
jgi:hypothetical protein